MKNKEEDLEIAKEHIDLAEDIVLEQAEESDKDKKEKLKDAAFSLEKAEADLEEC